MTTQKPATLLIRNARVCTMNHQQPWAEALAIVGGQVAWVGPDAEAGQWRGPGTHEIDGGGRLLLPGLIDSHFHLLLGARRLGGLWIDQNASLNACLAELGAYAARQPGDGWLRASGWGYQMFAGGQAIHRRLLDAVVPDRPLYAEAFDGHSGWANTAALQQAGMLGGAECGANSFVVMGDDGLATGELQEFAAMNLVRSLLPPFSRAEEDALLRQALAQAAALGITSIHNMDGNPDQIARYAALAEDGSLTLRVLMPMSLTPDSTLEDLDDLAAEFARYNGPLVRGGAAKLFMDGVVEAKTALMLAPYADGSGECGQPNYDQQHFEELVVRADALGLQVFVHAIGDGAVRQTLDAYEQALATNGPRDARHRVEHIEVLDAADLPRFNQLGAVASMQPLHANFGYSDDNPWRRLVGLARWPLSFPWRTLRDAGVPLAFGSDWPVVSQNPWAGLRAAARRKNLDGSAYGSGFPDQRLTIAEALAAYTTGGAYAEHAERQKGMLQAGMLADAVLLSHDILAHPETLDEVEAALTICDGRVVFER